jgi:YidC/Oxa1 family membrane protein insertase
MENKSLEKRSGFFIKALLFFVVFVLWQKIVINPIVERKNKGKKGVVDFTKIEVEEKESVAISDTEGVDTVLENDFLRLTINTKGLKLDNLELKKFQKSVDDRSYVKLLNNEDKKYHYIKNSWVTPDRTIDVPDERTLWEFDRVSSEHDDKKLVFSYKNKQNVIFTITFSLDEKYLLTIKQDIKNNANKNINLRPILEIIKFDYIDRENGSIYSGGIGVFDKNDVKEIKSKKLKNNSIEYDTFKWSGFTNKYWLAALIGNDKNDGKVNFLKDGNDLKMQYIGKNDVVLIQNAEESRENTIFLGPKDKNVLYEYEKENGFVLFTRSIDYGLFFFLTKPMYIMLNVLYFAVKDFGLSIFIFTILIKLILYPSTKKTTLSTLKMNKLQPKIEEIRSKYSDDKVKMQKELIKLYKVNEINPLGTFSALFVQIPVSFSLYKVLSISLDMRQANFFSFIKDLSVQDPSNIFNLCGLLPFSPSIRIGLLPFLMSFTMFLQQKIMTLSQDKTKQTEEMQIATNTSKWMPLILLFVFANLPSGLLLYWTWNNIIAIAQQIYIERVVLKRIQN